LTGTGVLTGIAAVTLKGLKIHFINSYPSEELVQVKIKEKMPDGHKVEEIFGHKLKCQFQG
jgi:hypothetical protein